MYWVIFKSKLMIHNEKHQTPDEGYMVYFKIFPFCRCTCYVEIACFFENIFVLPCQTHLLPLYEP